MSLTYKVSIDWLNDGDFVDAGDDVTKRVLARSALTVAFGRDQARALAQTAVGRASFDLNNISKDYSPENASSPLAGNLAPGKPVLIEATLNGTTYTLYRGYLDDYELHPENSDRSVTYSCLDSLARLGGVNVTTPLYQGITTGQAIGYILDGIGWSATLRDIDAGATVIANYWLDNVDAFTAVADIVASEGPSSFITIGADGSFIFRDRTHRLRLAASTTSQATWRDSGTEPCYSAPFPIDHGWRDIINSVTFPVDVRIAEGDLSTVWTSDIPINLEDGDTVPITVQASEPFLAAVVPVQDTDYTLDYGVVSMALSRTSGASTTIFVSASGGPAQVHGLSLRAYALPVVTTKQVSATESTSIAAYGTRSWPNSAPWAGANDALAIAQLILVQRAQRLPIVQVRFTSANDSRRTQMFVRDLSDRVTIVNAGLGLTSDFYIEQIQHTVTEAGKFQESVFGCEAVPMPNAATVFILNTSVLNTGTLGTEGADDPATVFILDSDLLNTGRLGH